MNPFPVYKVKQPPLMRSVGDIRPKIQKTLEKIRQKIYSSVVMVGYAIWRAEDVA
jgi:hypothetical protein